MIEVNDVVDVVGVYNSQFAQVFADAHQMKATINEEAQLMKQPREDGTTSVDHRIIMPTVVQLTVILSPANYRNAYQQIKSEFLKGSLFSIKTRTTIHQNMELSSMPREETSPNPDLISMLLSFEEVLYQTAQFQTLPPRSVKNKADASKVKRGQQAGSTTSSGSGSTLYRTIYGK